MLGLQLPTDPRWVNLAEKTIAEILIDHAYCEQKAASSCISLIINYPDREKLVEVLTPVVAEEWGHFERVMEKMKERNIPFGRKRKDEYVEKLISISKKGGSKEQQLVEQLLINAIIEARSCERFKMLSQNIDDDDLKKFYYELMVSEAGHYVNFVDLAKEYMPEEYVKTRLNDLLEQEAEIMRNLDIRGDRVH
ncbi:MAG: tRNA-(ms[2]io[6]A)-hydroxylase [Raineya sp.]|jgi:tRNA-(ms[2]io[6]A)-hydroxylase|nr:tRNA-(ms[2]io[6]A)-hydroxylase [Raineya sp.]